MKKKLIILILLIFFFVLVSTETIVDHRVYNLITNNKYLNYYKKNLQISSSNKYEGKSNFRIKLSKGSLYNIEHVNSNLILIANPPELKLIQKPENKIKNSEWNIIETNDKDKYIIQNINGCYIYYKNNNLKCENIKINDASKFSLLKVYDEVNPSEQDLELIEKEPIDVIIKYIDLSDPDLKREGIPQIKKDEDNEELKYCVRSVLKNIPWIRKIFIILPNKKVRFFKDYEFIKEKIVYIYDKDLIGKDSANSNTFQFNYWRLKYFNVSENVITMDDDYFIGKPLKKSDFFYVEEGKVVPAIVATEYLEETQNTIRRNRESKKRKALRANGKQNSDVFRYSVYNTYSFILKILQKTSLLVPLFTHNAIPCNLTNIKEIYDLVYNSEFKNETLDSVYRGLEVMQFQTLYMTYFFNKNYNMKVNPISQIYIDHYNALNYGFDKSLFVFNTGGDDYNPLSFVKARLAMEKGFPEPTPYEIFNCSSFPSYCINAVLDLEKELKESNKKNKEYKESERKNIENLKKLEKQIQKDKEEINNYKEEIKKKEEDIKKYKETINDLKKSKKNRNIFCIIETIFLITIILYIIIKNCLKQGKEKINLVKIEDNINQQKEGKEILELMNIE